MAGTGKSTIARTLAQSFADQGKLGATFFFKKGEGERGNASRFFSTIATELAAYEPGMIPSIRSAIDNDSTILESALKDQFEKLILHPLLDINQAQSQNLLRFIVVDALDECEREEDIQALLQLFPRTKDIKPISLRVLVTSRPELPIRLGFKQMLDGTYQDLVLHEVPKSTIKHDLHVFLDHELGNIRKKRLLSRDWPSKEQIQDLVELAVPLFIFAATICRYVGSKGSDPEEYLNRVLEYRKSTFSQVERTYLPILEQLLAEQEEDDRETWLCSFRELVGSIVILEEPLSATSLARFVQIPPKRIKTRLDSLHSVLSVPDDDDTPIRLLHLSFRDFLIDPQRRGKSPIWVEEQTTHRELAYRCLKLMSDPSGLRQDMCNLVRPGMLSSEIDKKTINDNLSPELQYACRYWVHHLDLCKTEIDDEDAADVFLRTHFLHWVEAMSLLSEAYKCIHLLKKLQARAKSNSILAFLHDAQRFMLRFRSILETAPLQVYSSALVFLPDASIIHKQFFNYTAQKIELLSGREKDWSACRITLEGHSDSITAVTFSPDGQLVASSSTDKSVRVWELSTGICRSMLTGHTDSVEATAFSPDGLLLATASFDETIQIWDTRTWSRLATLEGHSHGVSAVAFAPDFTSGNQLIVSGSYDKTVKLWDISKEYHCTTLEGHTGSVLAVAVSPDGQVIASASNDLTIRLWDRATASCRTTLKGQSAWITAIFFSPDSQLLVSAACPSKSGYLLNRGIPGPERTDSNLYTNDTIHIWDLATNLIQRELGHNSYLVSDMALSKNGKLVVVAYSIGTICIYSVETGMCYSTFEDPNGSPSAVDFTPDGQEAASGSLYGSVKLWDIPTQPCSLPIQSRIEGWSTVLCPPNGQLFVSCGEQTLRLWDPMTGTYIRTLENHPTGLPWPRFSSDSRFMVSKNSDHAMQLILWDTTTWLNRRLIGHSAAVITVRFSPDGQLLVSASFDEVRLWDIATGSCCKTLDSINILDAIVFSPDSRLVAMGSEDGTVRVWDVTTESCLTLGRHTSAVEDVAFSPSIQTLASASFDEAIRLWDITTGSYCTLAGHSSPVLAVDFSPDGQLLASTSSDESIRLWDVATRSCIATLDSHHISLEELAFSLDGTYLQTERGILHLPSSIVGTLPSPGQGRPAIFVEERWICLDGKRVFWLPPEYRTSHVAISGNTVCLSNLNSGPIFLRFYPKYTNGVWHL
ncbi:Nn.00g036850.m01.CDS01 [Neocucurbitaria sp. VM-36]